MRELGKPSIRLGIVCVVLLGIVATACGSDSGSSPSTASTTSTTGPKATGTINVSDAASLTEAFRRIGSDFTKANPNAMVTFNPGPSGTLATQIQQGSPVDTFAAADEDTMTNLVDANLVDGAPVVFARNRLAIVTKPGNPEHVKTLADLASVGVVSLCGDTAPCGKYAARILQTAGVTIPETSVTRGVDVKTTLGAVTEGDAAAAIVYVTDAKTAGSRVATIAIPDAENAIATYPIATIAASTSKATSHAFIRYVTSASGQATLRSYGFLPPR